jgi:uncharacterized protein (TIGR03086 family)
VTTSPGDQETIMPDVVELHREALAVTRSLVAAVRDDQWLSPTPCEGWDVRDLVNHIVSGNLWAAELGRGRTIDEVGDALDGDVLGDDPLHAYEASAGAADAAFSSPGAMEAACHVSYGPVTGSVYAGHRFVDVLIHGWDLAVAIGHDATLPSELVEACHEIIAPEVAGLRGSGMFGSDIEVAPDADRQTALLALLGRHA